jgi:hypothetical protein
LSAASSGVSATVVATVAAIINFTLHLHSATNTCEFRFERACLRGARL